MNHAYFDCFSGASGDMILGALHHAGCPIAVLETTVTALALPGVSVSAESVQVHGLAASKVHVAVEPGSQKKHRHLPDIVRIIDRADLAPRIGERAKRIFERLAAAEAAVHGTSVDKVHFHEVGAADAIVDIVGACAALEHFEIDRIGCSAIPTGSGTLTCEHGVMPVPAPATARLLEGVAIAACDEPGELTTPTGAAILTTLATHFGPLPDLILRGSGLGAGTRAGKTRANVLRVLLGETPAEDSAADETVLVLETQVDDATGQSLAFACETLQSAGALDTYLVPIIMKKGRPGQLLTVLARLEDAARLERIALAQTGSLGIRRRRCARRTLPREFETVATRFGEIRVKVGRERDGSARPWPEYEDCARAARQAGAALRTVQQEALRIWANQRDDA